MQESSLSVMRHAARGYLNAVKLCVSAMELDCTREEHIEFITDVITSSDKMDLLMGEIAEYFEKHPVDDDQAANS
jgi:hypothetical protein